MFRSLFAPTIEVSAHCDLPCGVYDPAQARIEAESIAAIIKKVADNDDPDFRTRAILIKEQRSELVKHHLWVLWTDYFKPPHFEKYPELHTPRERGDQAGRRQRHQGRDGRRRGPAAARQDRRDRPASSRRPSRAESHFITASPGPGHTGRVRARFRNEPPRADVVQAALTCGYGSSTPRGENSDSTSFEVSDDSCPG